MIKGLEVHDSSLVSMSKTIDITINVDDGHEWSEVAVRVKSHYNDETGMTDFEAEIIMGDFQPEEIKKICSYAVEQSKLID
jgi:hypothetical protein